MNKWPDAEGQSGVPAGDVAGEPRKRARAGAGRAAPFSIVMRLVAAHSQS